MKDEQVFVEPDWFLTVIEQVPDSNGNMDLCLQYEQLVWVQFTLVQQGAALHVF